MKKCIYQLWLVQNSKQPLAVAAARRPKIVCGGGGGGGQNFIILNVN